VGNVNTQLRDAYGLRYEAVDNHTFGRWGFSAVTDEDAWSRTEEYAAKVGHSQTLYRSMTTRNERVSLVRLPIGTWTDA
jgi:hypothetical protein